METVSEQDKASLALILREVKKLVPEQKQALSDYLLQTTLPNDNTLVMYFYLYDCFGDIQFLERLIPQIPPACDLAWFYEFYWNVSHRLFRRSGFSAPKNIAIVVPQLMHMRHSPTREAFNIALHLKHFHGCQVQVINTNSMNYENCRQLQLLMPANFEVNDTLQGQQQVPVNYMQFDDRVNTISFEAGPMSNQKLANIVSTLQQLEIEAVIAHGENLLVMECLYQHYPSLFATTGGVVPFNHCDAYFIPGNLFNDGAKMLAAEYCSPGPLSWIYCTYLILL